MLYSHMQKYKVLFAGSGEFAIPILEKLLQSQHFEVVGVITQPHKPVGREQKLAPARLEQWLMQDGWMEGLRLFRPEKLRLEAEQILSQTIPDVVMVAAYGQIVPDIMLNTPEYGALNFHGSLLPKLRGAVPVPMAILQGLTKTGVTLQKMVKQLDAGAVVAQQACKISLDDTSASLMTKLADIATGMLETEVLGYLEGRVELVEQDHAAATFCYEKDLDKSVAVVKHTTTKVQLDLMVRAFNPWPIVWGQFTIQKSVKRLKIYAISKVDENINTSQNPPENSDVVEPKVGQIRRLGKQLFLQLADGEVELVELQLEGKKQANALDYLYLAGAELAA